MTPVTFLRALPRLAFSSRLSLVAAASFPRVAIINAPTFARTLTAAGTKKTTATSAKAKAAPKKVVAAKNAAASNKKAPAAKKPVKKVAAKKPAAKKAAPKKRATKVLTEEEKKAKLMERKIKEAKVASLGKAPTKGALSNYNTFVKLQLTGAKGDAPNNIAALSQRYKSLTIEEVQNLAKEVEKANAERREAYKKWVEQYTPQQIEQANNARRWLKKHEVKRVDTRPIDDHRRVVAPRTSFMYFYLEDMKNNSATGPVADMAREAGRKWKALSAQEKAVYEQLAKGDAERYHKERAQAGF